MPSNPRYARHLLLPEVGSAGQARLCAYAVSAPDTPAGRVAAAYLERAGVRVAEIDLAQRRQDTKKASLLPLRLGAKLIPEEVASMAARPELTEAAAWVAGAFAAVEEIKRALNVGEPGSLEGVRLTGPKDEDDER